MVTINMIMRSWMSSIMGHIAQLHLELFALELEKKMFNLTLFTL